MMECGFCFEMSTSLSWSSMRVGGWVYLEVCSYAAAKQGRAGQGRQGKAKLRLRLRLRTIRCAISVGHARHNSSAFTAAPSDEAMHVTCLCKTLPLVS